MRPQILIFGVGQTGRMVESILVERDEVDVVGFVDDNDAMHGQEFEGYPVLGGREAISSANVDGVCVGLGRIAPRREVSEELRSDGVALWSAIHPSVLVPRRTTIGEGCIVGAGTVFYVNPTFGRSVFVGPGVVVSHDTTVGDHALISAGAVIGARVDIAPGAFVGTAATVMPPGWGPESRLSLGAGSVVGVGAVVIRDVQANDTVVGVPARSTRAN